MVFESWEMMVNQHCVCGKNKVSPRSRKFRKLPITNLTVNYWWFFRCAVNYATILADRFNSRILKLKTSREIFIVLCYEIDAIWSCILQRTLIGWNVNIINWRTSRTLGVRVRAVKITTVWTRRRRRETITISAEKTRVFLVHTNVEEREKDARRYDFRYHRRMRFTSRSAISMQTRIRMINRWDNGRYDM